MANFKDTKTMDEINKAIANNSRYINCLNRWVNPEEMEDIIIDMNAKIKGYEIEIKNYEKSLITLIKAIHKML